MTSGDERSSADSHVETLLEGRFGFTWGETDGTTWLRNEDGNYKRVHPAFFDRLRALARESHDLESIDAKVVRTLEELSAEGYFEPDGEIRRHDTPSDVRLWPRIGAFLAVIALFCLFVALRWPEVRALANELEFGPELALVVLPILLVATALHELGHYAVSRRYFDPSIKFALLNRVIPAVVTSTTDAWGCPRTVRIWISLAGPFVDAVLAMGFAAAFALFPEQHLVGFVALLLAARAAFVLNPLVEGDGYWVLVDAFGLHNLRRHGFRDLKRMNPSFPAVYASVVVLFTVGFVLVNLFVLATFLGVR